MKKLLSFLLLLSILQLSFSQTANTTRLDSFFTALEKANKWMGSVAAAKDGQVVYTRSVGFGNAENKTAANSNTRYRIGSISKTFTSVLVFKAIEAGKLSLEQPLAKYFPTIKNAETITIGQLLQHRSGIHNFTDDSVYLTYNTQPQTEQQMVAHIVKGGSDFEPGSKAAYSNSNFVLLAYILQSIYKKPYAQLLKEQIAVPLGLQNTFAGGKINSSSNEAFSYSFKKDKWVKEPETDMSVPMGAGAIVSTPTDLVKFANALFGSKLVSSQSLEKMKTMQDKYGMGLLPIPFHNQSGFGHTGGIDGFTSIFMYFPEIKVAYALTSNGNNFSNNDISLAVLSWINGTPFTIPTYTTFAVTTAELDQYLGIYSSKAFPLKITVTKSGDALITQATGQAAFAVTPTAKDVFTFQQAGIILTFKPAEKEMLLKQGSQTIVFTKE